MRVGGRERESGEGERVYESMRKELGIERERGGGQVMTMSSITSLYNTQLENFEDHLQAN